MEEQKCEYADLKVLPDELAFEVREGSQFIPHYQYIFIERVGPGRSTRWEISSNKKWFTVHQSWGEGVARVQVGCQSIGMKAGTYHAEATVTTIADAEIFDPVVKITLTVHPKNAPTPPAPPPDPEPEPPAPPPEPEPPEPEPPAPPPEPEPPEEKHWFIGFLEWLLEQLQKVWKH